MKGLEMKSLKILKLRATDWLYVLNEEIEDVTFFFVKFFVFSIILRRAYFSAKMNLQPQLATWNFVFWNYFRWLSCYIHHHYTKVLCNIFTVTPQCMREFFFFRIWLPIINNRPVLSTLKVINQRNSQFVTLFSA